MSQSEMYMLQCMRDHRSLPCWSSLLRPLCLAGPGSTQARNLEMDGETPLNGSHHFDTAIATLQEDFRISSRLIDNC